MCTQAAIRLEYLDVEIVRIDCFDRLDGRQLDEALVEPRPGGVTGVRHGGDGRPGTRSLAGGRSIGVEKGRPIAGVGDGGSVGVRRFGGSLSFLFLGVLPAERAVADFVPRQHAAAGVETQEAKDASTGIGIVVNDSRAVLQSLDDVQVETQRIQRNQRHPVRRPPHRLYRLVPAAAKML